MKKTMEFLETNRSINFPHTLFHSGTGTTVVLNAETAERTLSGNTTSICGGLYPDSTVVVIWTGKSFYHNLLVSDVLMS